MVELALSVYIKQKILQLQVWNSGSSSSSTVTFHLNATKGVDMM